MNGTGADGAMQTARASGRRVVLGRLGGSVLGGPLAPLTAGVGDDPAKKRNRQRAKDRDPEGNEKRTRARTAGQRYRIRTENVGTPAAEVVTTQT